MSTSAASSLGTRLTAERERRGFTLQQVSASTKIPVAHLEALERDDLSRWPKGLYRRAFFRSYVMALGLQPEPLAAEFARLYFDEPAGEPAPTADAAASSRALALDAPPAPMSAGPAGPDVLRSLIVALVEGAAVLAAGALLGWATGMALLAATGAVALVYYPSIRAGARRTRQSQKATLRPGESIGEHGRSPMPPPAQPDTVTAARLSAAQRLRARLAVVRTRLGHLHSHVARNWLPLAKRMIDAASEGSRRAGTRAWHVLRRAAVTTDRISSRVITLAGVVLWRAGTVATYAGRKSFLHAQRIIDTVSHGLRRAGTRAWHVLRRAAAATHRMSSHTVTWAAVELRRAGTVASDAVRKSFLHAQRTIATASQGSRRAGTRTWHVMRRAAVATYRMSGSVVIWATIVLWCAGTLASYVARVWFLRAKRMIATASQRSRQAGTRAWHVMHLAAVTTYRMSSRAATWAGVVLSHAGTVASHASGRTARQTGRICLRGLLWANQVFWRAMRSAAGHTEQLAARHLSPKSEGPAMAAFIATRGSPLRSTLRPRPPDADERGDPREDAEAGDLEAANPGQDWIEVIIKGPYQN